MHVRPAKLQNVIFPLHPWFSLSFALPHRVHRGAHILEIRRLFLGWVSSRKATTSGVGVARFSVKEASVEDAVVTTRLFGKWRRNERTRVVRLLQRRGCEQARFRRNAKRTPTPERSSYERTIDWDTSFYSAFLISAFSVPPVNSLSPTLPFSPTLTLSLTISPSYFRRRNKRTLNE